MRRRVKRYRKSGSRSSGIGDEPSIGVACNGHQIVRRWLVISTDTQGSLESCVEAKVMSAIGQCAARLRAVAHGSALARLLPVMLLILALPSSAWAQLVTRVVDGDTIVVAGVGTIWLIGVDTPETVDPRTPVQWFGKQASEFTRRMAQDKVARLEFDAQRKDKYQRTLAYAFLPDGTFLNAEIVKQGYG